MHARGSSFGKWGWKIERSLKNTVRYAVIVVNAILMLRVMTPKTAKLVPDGPGFNSNYAFGYWSVVGAIFLLGIAGWFLAYKDDEHLKWGSRIFLCFLPIGLVAFIFFYSDASPFR